MAETTARNAFHVIRGLQVKGGFLDGVRVAFDDNLNCVIGGRGTGKTTVMEILRWALDQMPDQRTSPILRRNIEKLVQANLGTGVVEVEIQTDSGLRYLVRRGYGGAAMVMNSAGEPVEIDIGRGTIFSAEVYSQSQIEEIANDPLFQLKLIDKFIADEVKEIEGTLDICVRELGVNGGEILKVRGEVAALKEKVSVLPEITEKLKTYKLEEGDEQGQVLRKAGEEKALRDRERRALERLRALFGETAERLREVVSGLPGTLDESMDKAMLDGPNGETFRRIRDLVENAGRDIRQRVDDAARVAEETNGALGERATEVSALHLKQEKAYQDLLELRDKEKDQATERDKLLRRQSELQEEQKRLEKRRDDLHEKERARATMLRRLSDLKDARFRQRMAVAQKLTSQLGPTIQVQIEQYGNTDAYRDILLDVMKGAGFKYTQIVEHAVERIPPHELAATVQRGDVQALADHLEVDADRANRFLLQLKDKPAVFAVEVVDLHDRPTIRLQDGVDYKDATVLSTGQKCTTILPILLLESASPLLIDQPEDNLDNAFIYETVVKSVRGVRGKRQLIFVTHNPNIPVLGDAQRVVVLQSDGRMASVKAIGSVDEVKDEIETVLEGGREAFRRRKERYGY
jgi:ABC-type lipoprotein export system ATPase subunit